MNQRQKLIAGVIAIPVLGILAYAATHNSATPVPPSPAPVASSAPATLAKAGEHKNKKTLEEFKENARKRMAAVDALTEEDYAKLRLIHPHIPATLAEYKLKAHNREDRVLNMTEEDFEARGHAGPRGARNGANHAKGNGPRATHQKEAVSTGTQADATVTASGVATTTDMSGDSGK